MPSLTPWNPVSLAPVSSTPHSSCGAAPTSLTSQSGKSKSFSGGNPTSSRCARSDPPTRMPLSDLPSVVSPHQPAPQRHGSSSTQPRPVGPRSKQNRGRGLSHACATRRYAFGLHTWLGKHIACHFLANFAQISHNVNFESNVLYHEFHTNFKPILQ